jgi:hypothetical protein
MEGLHEAQSAWNLWAQAAFTGRVLQRLETRLEETQVLRLVDHA